MMKAWPNCRDTWSSTTRATVSLALPAVNGLITCIARAGHVCAPAVDGLTMRAAPATAPHNVRTNVIRASLDSAKRLEALIGFASWRQDDPLRPSWQRVPGVLAAVARRRRASREQPSGDFTPANENRAACPADRNRACRS